MSAIAPTTGPLGENEPFIRNAISREKSVHEAIVRRPAAQIAMTAAAMQAAMKTRIGESLKMRIGKFPSYLHCDRPILPILRRALLRSCLAHGHLSGAGARHRIAKAYARPLVFQQPRSPFL
jgi:hypothetical protein